MPPASVDCSAQSRIVRRHPRTRTPDDRASAARGQCRLRRPHSCRAATPAPRRCRCHSARVLVPRLGGTVALCVKFPRALETEPGPPSASSVTTSPRRTSLAPTSGKFSAIRLPGPLTSSSQLCDCIRRIQVALPEGCMTIRCPLCRAPPSSVPVTTVPMPGSVKTRSIGRRGFPMSREGGVRPARARSSPLIPRCPAV